METGLDTYTVSLLQEARSFADAGRLTPAKILLDRALAALTEGYATWTDEVAQALARLYLDVKEPERAVYVLHQSEAGRAHHAALLRHAQYEAAAALKAGASPVDPASDFVDRVVRLPGYRPGDIRHVYREMAALLDPYDDEGARIVRPTVKPLQIYTICMTPRSGSNFLVRCLIETGALGQPGEYLHRNEPTAMPRIAARFKTPSLDAFMAEVMARTCTPNGVFGMKVHIGMLLPLLVEGTFARTLATGKFIYTTREDLLMQAISFTRARVTGDWISSSGPSEPAQFDFNAISGAVRYLAEMTSQWEMFFAFYGIRPLRISYEDIDRNIDAVIAQIADYLGVALKGETHFRDRRETVQRDGLSAEWRKRFLEKLNRPPTAAA